MENKKSGKLFGVFNLLDLVIILFVAAAGAALFWRLDLVKAVGAGSQDVTIEYTIRLEPVRLVTYLAVREGDPIYDSENGTLIGTVTEVETTPYLKEVTMADGSLVAAPDPENLTVLITGEGVGKSTQDGLMLGGNRICSPGGTIKVASTRLDSTGIFVMSRVKG
jgi:hypothetical protein